MALTEVKNLQVELIKLKDNLDKIKSKYSDIDLDEVLKRAGTSLDEFNTKLADFQTSIDGILSEVNVLNGIKDNLDTHDASDFAALAKEFERINSSLKIPGLSHEVVLEQEGKLVEIRKKLRDYYEDTTVFDSLTNDNLENELDLVIKAYEKSEDKHNEILNLQRKINEELKKTLKEMKEWEKSVKNIKDGYNKFVNGISKSFGIIKRGTEFWRTQDDHITKMVATFGLTSKEFDKYRKASYKAGVELAYQYGKTQEDMVKLQQGYAEQTSKNIVLTKENYESQFQLQQLMGEDDSLGATAGMEQFGVSIDDARDKIYDIYRINQKTGVSWSKTSKELRNNLKLAQKYNFDGGLKNMMEMSVWANQMRVNLQTIGSIADKISNPEGAIEMAANLQVLGGAFSSMANPLQMLYESLNDAGGLAKRVESMFDNLGRFDREIGEVTVTGPDRMRVKAAAEAMGISMEEAMEMVQNRVKRRAIMQDVQFNPELTEENRSFLATLSQWDNKQKEFVIRRYNAEKQEFETTNINKLSNEDIERLKQQPDDDIKKLVENTFSINATLKQLVTGVQAQKAQTLDNFRNDAITGVRTIKTMAEGFEYMGELLVGIDATLALIAAGQALGGLGRMAKGLGRPLGNIPKGMNGKGFSGTGGWAKAGNIASKGMGALGIAGLVGSAIGSERLSRWTGIEQETAGHALNTLNGVGTGAMIGSLIAPGVGTLIGGAIGGAVGGFAGEAPILKQTIGGNVSNGKGWFDDGLVSKGDRMAVPSTKVTPINDGVTSLAVSSSRDSALFAKEGGPFDKLFNGIITKVDDIDNYVRNSTTVGGNNTQNSSNDRILSRFERLSYENDTNTYNQVKNALKTLVLNDFISSVVGGTVNSLKGDVNTAVSSVDASSFNESTTVNSSGRYGSTNNVSGVDNSSSVDVRHALKSFVVENTRNESKSYADNGDVSTTSLENTENKAILSRFERFYNENGTNTHNQVKSALKTLIFNDSSVLEGDGISNYSVGGMLVRPTDTNEGIVAVSPVGSDKVDVSRSSSTVKNENVNRDYRKDSLKIEPLEINFNGRITLEGGRGVEVNLIEELKTNTELKRAITQMLIREISSTYNGGKPLLDQKRYATI